MNPQSYLDKNQACCQADLLDQVKRTTLTDEAVTQMASVFSALGDPTRLRLIHALVETELCVCDLAKVLQMSQSAVSHQLRYLKNLRIVKGRKSGRSVYYSIDDDHIVTLFTNGLNHIMHR